MFCHFGCSRSFGPMRRFRFLNPLFLVFIIAIPGRIVLGWGGGHDPLNTFAVEAFPEPVLSLLVPAFRRQIVKWSHAPDDFTPWEKQTMDLGKRGVVDFVEVTRTERDRAVIRALLQEKGVPYRPLDIRSLEAELGSDALPFVYNPDTKAGWQKPTCLYAILKPSIHVRPLAQLMEGDRALDIAGVALGPGNRPAHVFLPEYLVSPYLFTNAPPLNDPSRPRFDAVGQKVLSTLVEVGQQNLPRAAGKAKANEHIHQRRRKIQCRSATEKNMGRYCRNPSEGNHIAGIIGADVTREQQRFPSDIDPVACRWRRCETWRNRSQPDALSGSSRSVLRHGPHRRGGMQDQDGP